MQCKRRYRLSSVFRVAPRASRIVVSKRPKPTHSKSAVYLSRCQECDLSCVLFSPWPWRGWRALQSKGAPDCFLTLLAPSISCGTARR